MTGYLSNPCLLAVFAHPDDETFRPGGTLALLARRGVRVHLVTATRGQAGTYGEPPICRPEQLPVIREGELRAACAALGLEPPRVWDYADTHLAEANPEAVITHLFTILEEVQPQVVITFGPDGLSGHPDHIAIGQFAAEAFRRYGHAAALYTPAIPRTVAERLSLKTVHPVPDEEITLSVDVSSAWLAKRTAIQCHATQWSATPLLRASMEKQRIFFAREDFIRLFQPDPHRDFLPDLLMEYLL